MKTVRTNKFPSKRTVTFEVLPGYALAAVEVTDTAFEMKSLVTDAINNANKATVCTVFIDGYQFEETGPVEHRYFKVAGYVKLYRALAELLNPATYNKGMSEYANTLADTYEFLNPQMNEFRGTDEQLEYLAKLFDNESLDKYHGVLGGVRVQHVVAIYNLISLGVIRHPSKYGHANHVIPIIKALLTPTPVNVPSETVSPEDTLNRIKEDVIFDRTLVQFGLAETSPKKEDFNLHQDPGFAALAEKLSGGIITKSELVELENEFDRACTAMIFASTEATPYQIPQEAYTQQPTVTVEPPKSTPGEPYDGY